MRMVIKLNCTPHWFCFCYRKGWELVGYPTHLLCRPECTKKVRRLEVEEWRRNGKQHPR